MEIPKPVEVLSRNRIIRVPKGGPGGVNRLQEILDGLTRGIDHGKTDFFVALAIYDPDYINMNGEHDGVTADLLIEYDRQAGHYRERFRFYGEGTAECAVQGTGECIWHRSWIDAVREAQRSARLIVEKLASEQRIDDVDAARAYYDITFVPDP